MRRGVYSKAAFIGGFASIVAFSRIKTLSVKQKKQGWFYSREYIFLLPIFRRARPSELTGCFYERPFAIHASGVLDFLLDRTALWVGGLRKVGINLQPRHIGLH